MKIAIFGMGGIGGLIGGALAKVNEETYFVARGKHLEAIKEYGLHVKSVSLGEFCAKPKLASENPSDFGHCDVVFICCKGPSLEEACRAVSPIVDENSAVVPIQNGVLLSEKIEKLLPKCILADGVIRGYSHIEAPGYILHDSYPCAMIYGMRDSGKPEILRETADLLTSAGLKTRLSDNMLYEIWRKFIWTESIGTACCLYDGNLGKIKLDPKHKEVYADISRELMAVAKANGVEFAPGTVEKMTENFVDQPDETITSLYRDLESGKPADRTELDQLIGRTVEYGKELGIPTPLHEKAYNMWK